MSMQWWREAVVYEIYIRSFQDSDGNGVGDLDGICSRLPYLVELGVDALWITPFYPSPMADHGYDVADYRGVEPSFGDLPAFDRLLAEAHRLGLKVLVDVVPNHTSSAHAWFQEALADPTSRARSRYLFRDAAPSLDGTGDGTGGGTGDRTGGPPNNWQSVFGGPAWTRDSPSGQYYLHLFDSGQPDLDWTNPEVHEEFRSVLRFWLDRGVDGFRIDVAHGLYKRAGLPSVPVDPATSAPKDFAEGLMGPTEAWVWDQDEVVGVYQDWRTVTDSYDGDRMMVGEVFLLDADRVARYVGEDRLHQAFNFTVMTTPFEAARLKAVIQKGLASFATPTWVLSNHDLVRHVTRYGGGDLGRRRALAATAVMLALPGAPYLYQGEELGLEESDVPADARQDPIFLRTHGAEVGRDGCRTPIPWTTEQPGYGFTTAEPWLPFDGQGARLAVAAQVDDPGSVLSTYRTLLAHRRSLRGELGLEVTWLDAPDDMLAFRRGDLVCVLNTAAEPVELAVSGATRVLAATASEASYDGSVVTVPAAATVWLR